MLFQFGEYVLDDRQLTLSGPAGPIHLEPQVFGVLHYLIINRDRVVAKEELLDGVWGNRFVSESALTSRVKAARRAVGDDGQVQRFIKTVHGRGYRFIAEVHVPGGAAKRPLPLLRTVLLGRDEEIDGAIELISSSPLVTVTGSGGVGKTTLALAVAHRLQATFAEGAVFVDLSPIPPDGDVTRAVAESAGVEGEAAGSIESLADHLSNRPVLLVLDNCEHVLVGTAELTDRMLGHGSAARILATSREPLRVAGEHVWPLGPLVGAGATLFVERARAAEPRLQWDPMDPDVIEVCQRLDNLPLALELAAGQLRRFPLAELIKQLSSRLTLLSRRATGDSRRHATMEATIDWSYRLLDPAEQRLLRHLSVFPSSFGVEAAEQSAPPMSGAAAVDVLGELVDKSLVVRDPGDGRYRLLETIRVFARGFLDQSGEAPDALDRHRNHVVRSVTSASRLDRWMSARLAAAYRHELENARQAYRVSLRHGHVRDAVEIAAGAGFLWRNAMGCTEGDAWVGELLALELDPSDRRWALLLHADIGQGRGDYHQMFDAASTAKSLVTADDAISACLVTHYEALAYLTDHEQATGRLAAAMALARRAGEPRLVTLVEAFRAAADMAAEDYDAAHRLLERLEQTASEDGYDRFIAHWVGWTLAIAERDAAAAAHWMSAQQGFLNRTGIMETWLSSFSAAMTQVVAGGDFRDQLGRALTLADREGYRAEADGVLALAYAQLCAEHVEAAAELMGTAVRSRFNTTANYALYRVVLDRTVRRRLDPRDMKDAIARGRKRTAVEVLAEHGIVVAT